MTTGQKCKTTLYSLIPLLVYLFLISIITALPLWLPSLYPACFFQQVLCMAGCVGLGFLLFRGREGIDCKELVKLPTSGLLPPVMAALFLYASSQLLEMPAFSAAQQITSSIFSEEMNFLDFLSLLSNGSSGVPTGWQNIVFILLIAPICEEILCRYFPLTLCRKFASTPLLCIGSGIVFALMHLGSIASILSAFLGGAVLALLFLKTGKLWHCILAHMLFNATTLILQFQYSYHLYNDTGYTGTVWAIIQLVLLAVPVIWFFRSFRKTEA